MFFFLMVLIAALFQFKIYAYMVAGAYVEDALAASNLASALIDVEEYGRNHNVRIGDTQNAFRIYRDALHYNLALDEEGYSAKEELLSGRVQLQEYIVYNVLDRRYASRSMTEKETVWARKRPERGMSERRTVYWWSIPLYTAG